MLLEMEKYKKQLSKLRRDNKFGGAPHKPILLISIIDAFDSGFLDSQIIPISPELLSLFRSNWKNYVETPHDCRFALPFYHMKSEPFWRLVPNEGCKIWVESKSSMQSFNNLITAVAYAEIEKGLANLFLETKTRQDLRDFLVALYFGKTSSNYPDLYALENVRKDILKETSEAYASKLKYLKETLSPEDYEEELFVRGSLFKREVPKIYNFTCAVSGLRVDTTFSISMLDACHIVPFSVRGDDTIGNGIALCPNLHRAFDRGIITLDFSDLRVRTSKRFSEPQAVSYSIKQFEGKEIKSPEQINLEVFRANLAWHNENVFIG